ncbi:hypothetical protein JL721_11775 [Aureococcus anophagefferens]|nr:hypothetical protein JL721_11775 [Aureococcus anophagefferens]
MAAPAAPPQEWVPGYDGPDNPSGPFLLELNPGPEPSRDRLSGYGPDPAAFRAWYETEMCGLHALNVDNARQVAVLCFPTRNARDVVELMARHAVPLPDGRVAVLTIRSCPGSKPIALAEWEDVGSDVDAHTMASSLMSYFSTMFKPAAVDVAAPAETGGGGDPPPAPAPAGEDKNALGARLYPLIELSQPELAGKLTGMFLEMSEAELVRLLESPALLDAKVAEAVATLEAHGITRANAASPPASPGAPPDPPPSKRAMIRRLMSESRVKCTLAFDHWQVRDAVSHLCYLAGPRSDDGRGDRWLVRKLPKRGNGQDAGRTKRGAGAFLGGIADLDGDRVLKFFADELCAVEGVTAVDAHTAVAQFKLEAGCKCLRHQPLHLLFTADGRLFAFEVLDPGVVKNQHRNDLYVRWATPTPTDEKAARLEALADYLAHYTAATRLQTCGRPGRRVKAAKPEYGFLLFGNAVARDAVLELGNVRVDGRTLHVRPRTYSGDAAAPRRQNNGYYAPKQQPYVDAYGYAYHQPYYHQPRKPRYHQNYQNHPQHPYPNPYGYQPAPRYHRHEPPPPPVDPPSPAYSDEPPSPGVANGHDYTVEEPPSPMVALPTTGRGYRATMAACPPPGSDELSGFVPSGAAFSAWYEAEMCGLHALHIDRSRKTAVLCFPTRLAREVVERMTRHDVPLPDGASVALTVRSCPGRKPTAVAEWAGDSELDAGTMAKALMHYFSRCLRPTSVTVDLGEEPAYETRTVPGKDLNDDFANSASDGDEPGRWGRACSLVELSQPDLADKLTSKFLDSHSKDELLKLLESPVALDDKVAEAVANLDNGEASSAGSTAPTPDAPQTNGSTEKRRKPGGKVVGEIEFASLEARDAVVLLGYLNGPKGPDGRGDRWMLRRPPGEALPATADEFAQHLLFTAESRLLAFEVLGGSRLRGALRADGASTPRPRDVYVRWATATPPGESESRLATLREYLGSYTTAARLHASVPKGVQPEYGFLSFSSGVARDAVLSLGGVRIDGHHVHVRPVQHAPGTVPASVPARKLSGRADLADPARVALANARASRERAPGDRQPGSPRKLPYTYVIAEPDSPVAAAAASAAAAALRGGPSSPKPGCESLPLPAPIIITAGGTAASAQESTILQQLANFGDVLREERRRHDEDRARVVATMSLQLDELRAQVRAAAQPDVKSIVAALKEALAEEASGDADRAALLESAIPKVVAAHVAAANGNGTSDPSTYVDQTPAT